MNATSTKFAFLENEALKGGLPAATLGATGSDPARGRISPNPQAILAAVSDPLSLGGGGDSRSLAEALRERCPSSPVVVLFLSDHPDETLRAIGLREMERQQGSGHSGVLRFPPAATNTAASSVRRDAPSGEPSRATSQTPAARDLGLTTRQLQVLELMVQGKPNKLICRELRLAEGTVKCHVSAILRALEVGSRTQAALKAARLGLGGDQGFA
jgi:DNA-binding NarL/FixJ family response regulator